MKQYKDGFHRIAGYLVIIENGYVGRVCVNEDKGVWAVPFIPCKYGGWDNAYLQLTPDAFASVWKEIQSNSRKRRNTMNEKHAPIIDKETWEAAQKAMKARSPQEKPKPTQKKQVQKAERNTAPLGYKWDNGKLVIEETEAEYMRAAFEAAANGNLYRAEQLKQEVIKIREEKDG